MVNATDSLFLFVILLFCYIFRA